MARDPFGRVHLTMCDAGSWGRVAEAGVALASAPSEQLLQKFSKYFALLLGSKNPGQVMALSLALQLRGVPPALRGVFSTERQMWKDTETRQALIVADLLWLSSRGVKLHKEAGDVIACLRQQEYAAALSATFRLSYLLEALLKSRAFGQRDKVRMLVQPHSNELVIGPSLLVRQGRKIEPERIRQRLEEGGMAAAALPDGGQARQLDLGLVYRALYVADCFITTGKGYADAARYYNVLAPAAGKQASRSYIGKLCARMKSELPKALTAPIKPTKLEEETMV